MVIGLAIVHDDVSLFETWMYVPEALARFARFRIWKQIIDSLSAVLPPPPIFAHYATECPNINFTLNLGNHNLYIHVV